jgi:peptidoglycan/xylan/chitin deacetylase (PgdA/CDA1 family)
MFFLNIVLGFTFLVSCSNKSSKVDNHEVVKVADTTQQSKEKAITNNQIKSTPITYDSTKKYVYLTFDDGPQNGTVQCFNACKAANIKSTFFMVGAHATSPLLKQIVKDIKFDYPRSLLANHSTTHASGKYHYFYSHPQMAAQDFYKAQQTLEVPFKIIRLPGNTSWVFNGKLKANNLTKAVCKILDSVGYNVIGWDVEWNFRRGNSYPIQSAEKMYSQMVNALNTGSTMHKNHIVILTHDRMFRNKEHTDSLVKFIKLVQQNPNYVFETLDHYPNLKKPL